MMKIFSKLIAVILFAAMLMTFACPAFAAVIDIEIDIGSLFEPDTEGEDNTGNETSKPSGPPTTNDQTSKDDQTTTIPGDTPSDNTPENKDEKDEEKEETNLFVTKFSDVPENEWFYSYVTALASKGIITGYPDGTFAPQGNITRAEFIKLLVECMDYELTENAVFDDVAAKDWYYTYVSAAADNKIISTEAYGKEFKGDEKITREEVAALIIKATGVETGKYATPYADTDDKNIVALYTICLMQGSLDGKGNRYFYPESNITRAEVSAVFTRLLEYNADKETFVKEKMAEYGITELKLLSVPKTAVDYYETVKNAGLTPALTFVIELENPTPEITDEICTNLTEAFVACSDTHPEYFTHLLLDIVYTVNTEETGFLFFSFKSSSEEFTLSELDRMYKESRNHAKHAAEQIYLNSYHKDAYSLAGRVHDYITASTVYSDTLSDSVYLAYGVFEKKNAVCQGYSAAFNMICRELGIESVAVANENHMWNVIKYNGKLYYYDSTWDDRDSQNSAESTYRGVSKEKLEQTHGEFSLCEFAFAD